MSDDPLQVLRVYFVVDVSTLAAVPNEAQWQALFIQAKTKPLAAAILGFARASQNLISTHKRALGTGAMKYTLCVFEIDADDKAAALDVLNVQAALRSVTGTAAQKFTGVLLAELREAAVDLGYSTAQANKIALTVLNDPGVFDRTAAILKAQQYLAAQNGIWHSGG